MAAIYIGKSKIHGVGAFASSTLKKGEQIMIIWREGEGSFSLKSNYVNHGKAQSNTFLKKTKKGDIILFAKKEISPGEEIVSNYEEFLRLAPQLEEKVKFW
jgi:SET domain-containing protein